MSTPKKNLIRILISFIAFLPLFIITQFIQVNDILMLCLYLAIYFFISYDVFWSALKNIKNGHIFDENFLMLIATIGAFIIGEYGEGCAVMIFFQVGQLFEHYAVDKSRKSIANLMNICPDTATLLKNGVEEEVFPEEICVGDCIVVKAGEKIAVDGKIIQGHTTLNTQALNGESLPLDCGVGDSVLSGCINMDNVIVVEAEKQFSDSTVSKILELVENASNKKAKTESFITKFAKYYTPSVVILALIIAIIPSLFTGEWSRWVFSGLTFLVVSCPCALVISVPLSFFGGIGGASKEGILIKGANYFELINRANIFVFDKTGTLTKGKFEVEKISPINNKEEILRCAYICESGSNHPIAKSIVDVCKKEEIGEYDIKEISGKGIVASNKDDIILCGNEKLLEEYKIKFEKVNEVGSIVYVVKNKKYIGYILVSDSLKEDSKETIDYLNSEKIKTIMLTGDNEAIAKKIALDCGISDYTAGLLPHEKVESLEKIFEKKDEKDVIVYVGDGINDAPVLVRADVGISMGGIGSDSAIEASDIVLMHDKLSAIKTTKKIAKKTTTIVKENIIFALTIKFAVLLLSVLGILGNYIMWLAVFADVGVSVIAILNAMRCLKVKKEIKKGC